MAADPFACFCAAREALALMDDFADHLPPAFRFPPALPIPDPVVPFTEPQPPGRPAPFIPQTERDAAGAVPHSDLAFRYLPAPRKSAPGRLRARIDAGDIPDPSRTVSGPADAEWAAFANRARLKARLSTARPAAHEARAPTVDYAARDKQALDAIDAEAAAGWNYFAFYPIDAQRNPLFMS
jgi:hypothetical protein